VRRHTRVTLLGEAACSGQLGLDMQHFHGLCASHVARIGPQEAIQL
jgi:hypothetical protein